MGVFWVVTPRTSSLKPRYGNWLLREARGGAELEPRRPDIALPVLAGERRAATLTPVGGAPGEPGVIPWCARGDPSPMLTSGCAQGADVTLLPGR
jgi:hypothetical protein